MLFTRFLLTLMNEIRGVYPQQESKELFDTLASVSDFKSP